MTTTTAAQIVAKGVDFNSDEFIENPYETYAYLRREEPVTRIEGLNAWFVSRHRDVKAALLNDKQFRVEFERMQVNRMGEGVQEQPYYQFGQNWVVFSDKPQHSEIKKFLMTTFTRSHAEAHIPHMRETANAVIDEFIADGKAELMYQYGREVTLRIISDILGVPPHDRRMMESWVEAYTPVIGFPPMTAEQLRLANEATNHFNEYFSASLEHRRNEGGDDLIAQTLIANAKREVPFNDRQLIANLILLYFAGQDTQTGHFGNMLVALHQHPASLQWLLEEPQRVWGVMDELMRYDSVSQIVARIAVVDTEIAGCPIGAGELVLLSMGAANRDPEVFDDPDRFDLQRKDAGSALTFGAGPHSCLGTHFARMLMPIMLEALMLRIPDLKVDMGGLVRKRTLSKHVFDKLPATW